MNRSYRLVLLALPFIMACNPLKFVPEDKYLLHRVEIVTSDKELPKSEIKQYIHQQPNERFLGLFRLNLWWYNLSGADTTKWYNRTFRSMGEPPVLYDPVMVERSRNSIRRYLLNRGYLNAQIDTMVKVMDRKVTVYYQVNSGLPYRVRDYMLDPVSDPISRQIEASMNSSLIKPGSLLDTELLDKERDRIVRQLQRQGYFAFSKDYLVFKIDSAYGDYTAKVRLSLKPWQSDTLGAPPADTLSSPAYHPLFRIQSVYFMLDVPMSSFFRSTTFQSGTQMGQAAFRLADYDTLVYDGYKVIYRGKPFIKPEVLIQNCRIIPGQLYDVQSVERTYTKLNTLQILKYTNIRFLETAAADSEARMLDCYIVLTPGYKQSFSAELEGTNTAGDMGVAGNLAIAHRNLFQGAEVMQARLRGAYEALSASLQNDYTELGGELSLLFPDFKMPFLQRDFKKRVEASTELALSYQNMSRPEFLRTIASSSVRYNWTRNMLRQTLDLIDLSYVYMPRVDPTFKEKYLTNQSYLKYSYEDHFILRSNYSFSYSSLPPGNINRTYYTLRGSFESAGNALYAIYYLAGMPKEEDHYTIGNIRYAQYVRGDFEYARSIAFNERNRLAFRVGAGLACPYGNSQILPFEKRFFSGGANSVRGWSVRTLGPGSYRNVNGGIDFMNQSGDIKLDLGIEHRSLLFWKLESALFADAGNSWTIKKYDEQPGGQFQLNTFYQQLAASLGVGLRLNLGFVLIRLDLGMKVFDPSLAGAERWRIRHIDSTDDFALHLAIGYPF